MKKFIFAFLSVMLIFAMALGGCSCSGCSSGSLEFEPLFYGTSGKPNDGYLQQSTYKVELKDSYGNEISKNKQLDNYITYDYDGTYISRLEVLSQLDSKIQTDMREDIKSSQVLIYKLTTKLDLKFTYTIKGQSQPTEVDDFIYTEAYFTPANSGFTPIYVQTESSMTYIGIDSVGAKVEKLTANNSVTYNNENYVMTTKYDNDEATTKTYEYSRQTVIDNSQLLFVLRSLNLGDKEQFELPVISYQYGEEKNIMVTNDGVGKTQVEINQDNPLSVNEEAFNQNSIKVKRYKFKLSTDRNMGAEQFVYIQDGENGNLGNRSFMYRYVEPIYTLGSYTCLGVLDYTLTNVSFS